MKFWDSSAIVPLVVEEPTSRACRQLLRADSVQVVWYFTRTEILSALVRQQRNGLLTSQAVNSVQDRIEKLAMRWSEIVAMDQVRNEAELLVRRYPLRAADALQLGAALVWAEGSPRGKQFVSLDENLLSSAQAEGFDTLVPRGK